MRRRKGIMGTIFSILGLIIIAGIFFAVMREFDGDFIAAIYWFFKTVFDLIGRVADKFTDMPGFRQVFKA